jgi:hypothetical protein
MNFKEFYLNEMIVVGKPASTKYVIAFDKWIYVLDPNEPNEEIFTKILSQLKLDQKDEHDNLINNFDFEDTYTFLSNVQTYIGDVLIGQINGSDLYLYDYGSFKLDPKSSILVKKVIEQLKLKSASYVEDIDSTTTTIKKKKMIGKIPEVFYHGTSSNYFNAIMKIGLKPGEADSNYKAQGIYHYELIFFTSRIGEAMGHAQHTAKQKGGTAIILEFTVPDKNLIVADYDIERLSDTTRYYADIDTRKSKHDASSYKKDPDKLSSEFGIYGYKGRIAPVFIKNVYVAQKPTDQIYNITTDFKKMKPKQLIRLIDQGYLDY